MIKKSGIIFMLSVLLLQCVKAQDVFQHISNTNIYEYLDELANQQVIVLNTAIKPYSRHLIAGKLQEAAGKRDLLSKRQQKELDFYLKDFNKELLPGKTGYKKRLDLFYYKDTLFTLSINPILGVEFWKNDNSSAYHRWEGAEAFAYVGTHVGVYASLRDNHENKFLSLPSFLNQRPGVAYKENGVSEGGDYSEARGGIVYSWKWGYTGIVKDHFVWGSNYNGANIFSGKTPSFPHIKLNMKPVSWLEFNYVHGFLVSDIIDTSRSYVAGVQKRDVFVPKFMAANMFTITPFKGLNVSIGNSIIYSDEFQLGYLIPIYFFKSVDHSTTNTGGNYLGQNSQMYFDISSRQIKYLHLYASVFIDEIAIGRITDSLQSNFVSGKIGVALSHPVVPNTTFIAEYTRTNPITYKHFVNTTSFESNGFNMGHYLRDNSEEIYLGIRCRPYPRLYLNASYTLARAGENYTYTGTGGSGLGLPFISKTKWKNNDISLSARFEVINDGFVFASVNMGEVTGDSTYVSAYSPKIFAGKTTTIHAGINIGF